MVSKPLINTENDRFIQKVQKIFYEITTKQFNSLIAERILLSLRIEVSFPCTT